MSPNLGGSALVVGYAMAVPFTLWVPGFRRMWKRREPWVFATEQAGAALIVAGWAVQGNTGAVLVNVVWFLAFGAAYTIKGRVSR